MAVFVSNVQEEDNTNEILLKVYPIGSIYMSVTNINPGTLFGGTWDEWGAGKVPVGVNSSDTDFETVEKTGGNKSLQSHDHNIDINSGGGGAHTHSVSITSASGGSHTHQLNRIGALTNDSDAHNRYFMTGSTTTGKIPTSTGGDHTHKVSGNTGSGGSHSHAVVGYTEKTGNGDSQNLQPYITCYMWKRIE